jgi:radical SAM protein with 4Fe4S-binding SPASM domain
MFTDVNPSPFTREISLPSSDLWDKQIKRQLLSFNLELTARCNNNCRHCYINLPHDSIEARAKELTLQELKSLIDEAVSLGALWCLITGGEPLVREDFSEIYLYLKRKGLLVSIFTNAALITEEHIKLFKKYSPRDIEITVYGVTEKTYEMVTGKKGFYGNFIKNLDGLLKNQIKVRLKTMTLRSNVHELPLIADFCRERTKDYFRFDPFLHLRYDRNERKNQLIISERLTGEEIIEIEKNDPMRFQLLKKKCDNITDKNDFTGNSRRLFKCGAGNGSFTMSYDGYFRLCSSLCHKDCIYDLRKGNLTYGWNNFVPEVRNMTGNSEEYLNKCNKCPLINLCYWCPAHADLETGSPEKPVEYFCRVADKRVEELSRKQK